MNKEKITNYLTIEINKAIEFDCVPENDEGWYEVKQHNIAKIVDGLIPLIETELKTTKTSKSSKKQ